MLPRPLAISAQVLQRAARATTTAPTTQGGLRGQHAASTMQQNGTFASYNQTSSSGGSSGSSSTLQAFFSSAKAAVLRGGLNETNAETVNSLLRLMGHISLEELGLDPDMVQDPFLGALKLHLRDSRIKYMRIYEDHTLTFGLFCFPAGATIPLHNHPGMTVFSRLLFGRLRVSAFDWVVQPPEPITEGSGHRAQLVYDATVEASSPPLVLFPASGGNLHEFTAETPCAVLDLLTPPYEPPTRNCTYYRLQRPPMAWPVARSAGGRAPVGPPLPALGEVVELEVFEPPDSFEVVSGLYPGDPVS